MKCPRMEMDAAASRRRGHGIDRPLASRMGREWSPGPQSLGCRPSLMELRATSGRGADLGAILGTKGSLGASPQLDKAPEPRPSVFILCFVLIPRVFLIGCLAYWLAVLTEKERYGIAPELLGAVTVFQVILGTTLCLQVAVFVLVCLDFIAESRGKRKCIVPWILVTSLNIGNNVMFVAALTAHGIQTHVSVPLFLGDILDDLGALVMFLHSCSGSKDTGPIDRRKALKSLRACLLTAISAKAVAILLYLSALMVCLAAWFHVLVALPFLAYYIFVNALVVARFCSLYLAATQEAADARDAADAWTARVAWDEDPPDAFHCQHHQQEVDFADYYFQGDLESQVDQIEAEVIPAGVKALAACGGHPV